MLPGIVVAVWGDTCVNLQVFTDGVNSEQGGLPNSSPPPVKWITSATFDDSADPANYTWHWPPRV